MTFTNAPSFLSGASQCTSNFVYTDASGNVYLGQAAHCSSTGESTETNGCTTKSLPLGTSIYSGEIVNGGVQNGTLIGTLAYNSWIAMQSKHETDREHLRLQRPRADQDRSRPRSPTSTRPCRSGVARTASPRASRQTGDRVFTYGNSILRLGVSALSPKTGVSLGEQEETGGWSQQLYTVTPGIPGDSGSGFMDAERQRAGRALDRRVRTGAGEQRRRHARQGARLRQQRDRARPHGRDRNHPVQLGAGPAGRMSD